MMTQTATSETPNIAQNYLQVPYNQYIWVRKEFMEICKDLLEAMILRVVEYEIEGDRRVWVRKATEVIEQGKPAPEEPEWWITLSHKQIITRLYESLRNEKTLRAKLKSLIDKKFLLVRDNPDNHYGAPQYTLNKELIQQELNDLPPLPGIKEAAKSQANPLPETVPPTRNGTPYQSRQEGGTKTGSNPLPETVPATSQNRQEGGTVSGRTNKNKKNSKNSQNTEEGLNTPTPSSLTGNSLIHSSSSLNSQETKDTPPLSPDPETKGSASPSGLRIAPHDNNSSPPLPDMPVSPPQGYKTDDRPDTAVTTNNTEADETIASLDQLRFWLRKLRIHGSSDPAKRAADLEEILPCVKDKATLLALIADADAALFARYNEHRQVFVGNLADRAKLRHASQSPGQAPASSPAYAPSEKGMDLVERDDLKRGLYAYCEDFVISEAPDTNDRWFVAIWHGIGERDYIEMGDTGDFAKIPREWIACAIAYGDWLRQQQAEPSPVAVGM